MNFFTGKDNSFYFHLYEWKSTNLNTPRIPLEEREDNKIDFSNFVETDFKRNKLSMHESGYIHSTDNFGNKFKKGVVGFAFDKIDKSLLFLVVGPKNLENLIEIEKTNPNTDLIVDLPKGIRPFTIHFDVYRISKTSELDISNPNVIFGGFIMTEYDGKEFGLRIYFQSVRGKTLWPPFSLILARI